MQRVHFGNWKQPAISFHRGNRSHIQFSINQSINRPINQSINRTINRPFLVQSINQSIIPVLELINNQTINRSIDYWTVGILLHRSANLFFPETVVCVSQNRQENDKRHSHSKSDHEPAPTRFGRRLPVNFNLPGLHLETLRVAGVAGVVPLIVQSHLIADEYGAMYALIPNGAELTDQHTALGPLVGRRRRSGRGAVQSECALVLDLLLARVVPHMLVKLRNYCRWKMTKKF